MRIEIFKQKIRKRKKKDFKFQDKLFFNRKSPAGHEIINTSMMRKTKLIIRLQDNPHCMLCQSFQSSVDFLIIEHAGFNYKIEISTEGIRG